MKEYKDIAVVIPGLTLNKEDNKQVQLIFKDTLRQVKDFARAKGLNEDALTCYISAFAPVDPSNIIAPSSMAITTQATKKTYNAGDTFVKTGLKCTVTYSNGATKVITADGLTADTTTPLTATDTAVTIYYNEAGVTLTASQAITVTAAS